MKRTATAQHVAFLKAEKQRVADWDQRRQAIADQRDHGRTVTETITEPSGRITTKVTHQQGVDPALFWALSTHHDRRARQLDNQIGPDAGVQAVQVNVVKDFLSQGDTQGKLSAQQWNEAIDVTPAAIAVGHSFQTNCHSWTSTHPFPQMCANLCARPSVDVAYWPGVVQEYLHTCYGSNGGMGSS